MKRDLINLIKEAQRNVAPPDCVKTGNHDFVIAGGRPCPYNSDLAEDCSQTVYYCIACDGVDYGERNGPGWKSCVEFCEHGGPEFIRPKTP